jgi:hypothetical protein
MVGLDPAIHALLIFHQDVDARDKRGHDEGSKRSNASVPLQPDLSITINTGVH